MLEFKIIIIIKIYNKFILNLQFKKYFFENEVLVANKEIDEEKLDKEIEKA